MVLRVILLIKNKPNKFQDQFMITTIKIQFHIWVEKIIQKLYMDSTTNLISKKEHALKDKNNTFMDVKERAQEPIFLLNLFICHWPKKHHNSQFLEMIEVFWLRNSRESQDQEIMKVAHKVLRSGIKFKPSQCQGHPEM